MSKLTPQTVFLESYTPPDYTIETVILSFDLGEDHTDVEATLSLRRLTDNAQAPPLVLNGSTLELLSVTLDGRTLSKNDYAVGEHSLTIASVPEHFELALKTRIYPHLNTSLDGLYRSSEIFCTQCEAEGFRKITYFLDRPDVMAVYTTTLVADRSRYPVLLSNGNLVDSGTRDDGRHFATWHDPHKKPSYLFALVAGDLGCLEDGFRTRSGRDVTLRIYADSKHLDQCEHAMQSLKHAMTWDEDTYGLEYDLDIYMIVAVGDFNMGAMENKGLNVFNTKYVLAKPETATDADYQGVEGVIAHEYFHNWTGNRVTCRDWFQLSLKEGLTVFRDQEFSADMSSRGVRRIDDVRVLRNVQFAEDAGPMAHPVRPESYIEINNFYTVTVYNKGAEVVRMMHNLVGRDGFRRGMDLYFQRHDGQAVTCDDFVAAMEDANSADLQQFRNWYSQAGTPELRIERAYDTANASYTLTVKQSCPPTPGQKQKRPFHIPLSVGLIDADGNDMPLQLAGENAARGSTRVLELREAEQRFEFINVASEPVPSLLRGFSAPVKLEAAYSNEELMFLLGNDSDDFNRWEAGQQLALRTLLGLIEDRRQDRPWKLPREFFAAFRRALKADTDPALTAQVLSLPTENYVAEQMDVADVDGIHLARQHLISSLATELHTDWLDCYQQHRDTGAYRTDQDAIGRRALKNVSLHYLLQSSGAESLALCSQQLREAGNMTDELGALAALTNHDGAERIAAMTAFYQRWKGEALVIDKWFSLQATSHLPGALAEVRALMSHPAFTLKNPNKVRALIGTFSRANPVRFHAEDGSGYVFLADQVLTLNKLNPQIAARLLGAFGRWRKYDSKRRAAMQRQLSRIASAPELSPDVYEIATKTLDNT